MKTCFTDKGDTGRQPHHSGKCDGEVLTPGTYALSSFSSVFHALYRAGGVNDIGSLRAIQLVRGGKPIATIDVYDFIMRGKATDDIRLQEGMLSLCLLIKPW